MLKFLPCCLLENLKWLGGCFSLLFTQNKSSTQSILTRHRLTGYYVKQLLPGKKKKKSIVLFQRLCLKLCCVILCLLPPPPSPPCFWVNSSTILSLFSLLVPFIPSDYPFRTARCWMKEWLKLLKGVVDCTVVKFLFQKKPLGLLCIQWKSWSGNEL